MIISISDISHHRMLVTTALLSAVEDGSDRALNAFIVSWLCQYHHDDYIIFDNSCLLCDTVISVVLINQQKFWNWFQFNDFILILMCDWWVFLDSYALNRRCDLNCFFFHSFIDCVWWWWSSDWHNRKRSAWTQISHIVHRYIFHCHVWLRNRRKWINNSSLEIRRHHWWWSISNMCRNSCDKRQSHSCSVNNRYKSVCDKSCDQRRS